MQIVAGRGETHLFSRTGDDIGRSFPDVMSGLQLRRRARRRAAGACATAHVASFNDLQQRLNRKAVSKRQLEQFPAHVRLYDALLIEGEDLRQLPFVERRARLEAWHARTHPPRTDLSPLIAAPSKDELQKLWAATRETGIEGLMLKRRDSPYVAGRPKGLWWKWKRAPLTLDCVLMYAQRGSGKRSSYYSDYTFGVWRDGEGGSPELVPVGKAYFGFTDEELLRDRPLGAQPHDGELRPGARRRPRPGLRGRLRCRAALDAATSPASPCASPASTASAGTSPRARPIGWRRWWR